MNKPKLFINLLIFAGTIASIIGLWPLMKFYSLFFIIVPMVFVVVTYFWELIVQSLKERKTRSQKLKEAQTILQESEKKEAQIRVLIEELKKELEEAQGEAQKKVREKAATEAQIDALTEEMQREVQFYPSDSTRPSGLDSEEAIEIIKEANSEICVTHFIPSAPSNDLLDIISKLEKKLIFRRLVFFNKDIVDENRRRECYSWLKDRIKSKLTHNKVIPGEPFPLDLLIVVDAKILLLELPNIGSDDSNLLLIKKEGVAIAFQRMFVDVFNNHSEDLTLKMLESYILTGEIN